MGLRGGYGSEAGTEVLDVPPPVYEPRGHSMDEENAGLVADGKMPLSERISWGWDFLGKGWEWEGGIFGEERQEKESIGDINEYWEWGISSYLNERERERIWNRNSMRQAGIDSFIFFPKGRKEGRSKRFKDWDCFYIPFI
jgi:hypothetical protein